MSIFVFASHEIDILFDRRRYLYSQVMTFDDCTVHQAISIKQLKSFLSSLTTMGSNYTLLANNSDSEANEQIFPIFKRSNNRKRKRYQMDTSNESPSNPFNSIHYIGMDRLIDIQKKEKDSIIDCCCQSFFFHLL